MFNIVELIVVALYFLLLGYALANRKKRGNDDD